MLRAMAAQPVTLFAEEFSGYVLLAWELYPPKHGRKTRQDRVIRDAGAVDTPSVAGCHSGARARRRQTRSC